MPFEDDDAPDQSSQPPSPCAIAADEEERAADSPSILQSAKKHKTPQDLMKEVADAECQAHLVMNETNAKERTARKQIKCQSTHDTALTVEALCLRMQQEQAAAQHAHKLPMMDKQIELAPLQHGGFPGTIDPQLRG
ncbi:hypothetical protein PAXRUDRAFT_14999 [Paxillus rubicundulus Ve08.2h10]|uniref:Uncharacterized protein n=1 Tax=Paxillus rubicundulus Ve08.2h10 TaxID=930991 RepID=A0A0D0DCI0_9AGAM|nr:hypothetical protein PAXRUDRAFT_14999 [Paxillus rubicundulus Ve08.2h10]